MHVGKSVLPLGICVLVLGLSCRLEEPSTYAQPIEAGSTSEVVGPNGGTVMADDGTTVDIPAGALTEEVTITIEANPYAPALTQAQALGVAHLFLPEGQKFQKPVSVTMEFNPASLPAGATPETVQIFTAPGGSNFYQSLDTKLSGSTHVTATTLDFCNMYPGANSSTSVQL
jgi:hypothetical protein